MPQTGQHKNVANWGKDINNLTMIHCYDCGATAHATNEQQGRENLATTNCVKDCRNCRNLRNSHSKAPAIPEGGTCNDVHHICPNCGKRWWQFNTHLHLWQQMV
jgi:hypothetical protein